MKITMYELLGMVKDGKAPKKIKWGDTKYTLYIDEDTKQKYYQDDKCRYFFLSIKCLNDLNDEVEIIEDIEENKIPDDLYYLFTMDYNDDLHEVIKKSNINFKNICEKLDKILDYPKSKGDE